MTLFCLFKKRKLLKLKPQIIFYITAVFLSLKFEKVWSTLAFNNIREHTEKIPPHITLKNIFWYTVRYSIIWLQLVWSMKFVQLRITYLVWLPWKNDLRLQRSQAVWTMRQTEWKWRLFPWKASVIASLILAATSLQLAWKHIRPSAVYLPFAACLEQEAQRKCWEEVGCDAWWAAASGLLFCISLVL